MNPSPWLVLVCGAECETQDGTDRIRQIKASTDRYWLRAVAAWPRNQKTVQAAVERRLRKLDRSRSAGKNRTAVACGLWTFL